MDEEISKRLDGESDGDEKKGVRSVGFERV
jgi:hypothetical protein